VGGHEEISKKDKMSKHKKRWSDMTTDELAEATREFDVEFVADKGKPLSDEGRKVFERSAALHRKRRGRGRPRIGQGSRNP
jgi:hypothetical protein